MLTTDQFQPSGHDLSIPYAKLVRHVSAMYEVVRIHPSDSAFTIDQITKHLRECLDMIVTLEKWTMNPVTVIGPDRPEDYLDPEHVRMRHDSLDRLQPRPATTPTKAD